MATRENIMQDRRYIVLGLLAGLSATASVAGLVIAGKPHQIMLGATVPISMWFFPLVFVFGSMITEIYGARVARGVTVATFVCTILAVLYYVLAILLPYPDYWQNQGAFQTVLVTTPRIVIASIFAYLIASYANIGVLVAVSKLTGGRYLWLRIVLAAFASQCVDSVLFVGLAFYGTMPGNAVVPMMLTSALLKIAMQLAGIPVSYFIVNKIRRMV